MKCVALVATALSVCLCLSYAGTERYAGKEMEEPPVTTCDWYGGHQWEISVWGAYAFPGNQNGQDLFNIGFFHELHEGADNHEANLGRLQTDRFLNDDDVGGGGLDLKYFFNKYIGVGLEGYALSANTTVGGALVTLTLRYPIGCTPLAPYVFGGIGAAFGASQSVAAEDEFNEVFLERELHSDSAILAGAVGGGVEYRFTKRVGVMADFSWHILDKPDNNFYMIRSGITFGF